MQDFRADLRDGGVLRVVATRYQRVDSADFHYGLHRRLSVSEGGAAALPHCCRRGRLRGVDLGQCSADFHVLPRAANRALAERRPLLEQVS